MNDVAIGYLLLGIGIASVLGVVYGITSHISAPAAAPKPPRGVHLPNPSPLPVVMAVGGAMLGAGLAFRADDQIANPLLAIPGLVVFLYAAIAWVRAASREWHEVERGPHDDAPGH